MITALPTIGMTNKTAAQRTLTSEGEATDSGSHWWGIKAHGVTFVFILIQILISEIKLQFYLFLPIASSFLSRSYPKIYHPPPQPLAFFFLSLSTPPPPTVDTTPVKSTLSPIKQTSLSLCPNAGNLHRFHSSK